MIPVVFALPGNAAMASSLASDLGAELGRAEIRYFPDGESYVRINSPVAGRPVILVCTLDSPDKKILPLIFMAATARDLGAIHVGLVCPYLAYMRQDKRFRPGEAISSVYFGQLLSASIDHIVTVDPHLHRHHSLAGIFSIPASTVGAAPRLAAWIRDNVANPVLIGPDSESEQWAKSVASNASAPYIVLNKIRNGDRDVDISMPDLRRYGGRTPVLVDDIISTGRTMMATMRHLRAMGYHPPVCLGVHAIFAENAYAGLRDAGAARIITCNTIPHESNMVDVTALISGAVREMLGQIGQSRRTPGQADA